MRERTFKPLIYWLPSIKGLEASLTGSIADDVPSIAYDPRAERRAAALVAAAQVRTSGGSGQEFQGQAASMRLCTRRSAFAGQRKDRPGNARRWPVRVPAPEDSASSRNPPFRVSSSAAIKEDLKRPVCNVGIRRQGSRHR